jgi:sugar diacid utilization regulator
MMEEHRPQTPEQRRVEQVRRLLEGGEVDAFDFSYNVDAFHLGVIAVGPGAAEVLQRLSVQLDYRLLTVSPDEKTIWAWLGGRRRPSINELQRLLSGGCSPQITLATGEPSDGLIGWRLTHRQAQAALTVALRESRPFVRYADAALLASTLQDDLLATSLHQLYLAPLESQRDGGKIARETLRAYFAAGCNSTSAAAALDVDRRTVRYRLRKIEDLMGCPPATVTPEMVLALRLHDAGGTPDTSTGVV